MLIQISMIRNDLLLIKKMLPIWKEYADAFVFYVDNSGDDLIKYLNSVKIEYNILELIINNRDENDLTFETDARQKLFDVGRKYSKHIICLDADEYLCGELNKQDLLKLLDGNPNTVFYLRWRQYTSVNTIRVDGPWAENFKDRIGTYDESSVFDKVQMHSTHLPILKNKKVISDSDLHIAHLQWMNKLYVSIKQYFWKVCDYITENIHGIPTAGILAYDESVNNFDWQEEYVDELCKVPSWVFEDLAVNDNYRLNFIREMSIKYNIPNLGMWGYDILGFKNDEKKVINKFKISVITAIGDLSKYEKFIPRYIANVKEQHFFSETEHIIIYSEWSEYFDDLTKSYNNFKFIKEDEKKGVYNAWNIGIKASTTEYITNWNIDDIRHPINTKIKYDLLKNNPYDFVYNYYTGTRDESLSFEDIDINNAPHAQYPDEYHKYVLDACYAGPDPMWKKSLHDVVGYFDYERFNTIGDWEMWIRFANASFVFKLIPIVLCIYLDHPNTISTRQLDKSKNEKILLNKIYGANSAH